jgi:hypothetical protein
VHDRLGATGCTRLRRQHLDQFLIFVVNRHRQAGFRDFLKRGQHRRMVDARKAHCVVLVGGKLERRYAASRQFRDRTDAGGLRNGAVQRHVDMRRPLHPGDLVGQDRRIGHRKRYVIRHVDTGGHATGGCALRRGFDAWPAGGRRCVHVTVDQSGQNELAAVIDGVDRGRRCTFADRRDRLAAHRDVAVRYDGITGDQLADDHSVEWY